MTATAFPAAVPFPTWHRDEVPVPPAVSIDAVRSWLRLFGGRIVGVAEVAEAFGVDPKELVRELLLETARTTGLRFCRNGRGQIAALQGGA